MGGSAVHWLVEGSNKFVSGRPMEVSMCPPITTNRPSASGAWPEQKRLVRLLGIGVNTFVVGVHRVALNPPLTPVFAPPSNTTTWPFGMSARLIATSGHE